MICPKCKKQIDDNSAFCTFCGAKIQPSSAAAGRFSLIAGILICVFAVIFLFGGEFLLFVLFVAIGAFFLGVSKRDNRPSGDSTGHPAKIDPIGKIAKMPEPAPHLSAPESSARSGAAIKSVPTDDRNKKTYRVTGMSNYEDNLLNLASENSDYELSKRELIDSGLIDEQIWKYDFYPEKVELVPEPDNPQDGNAIKVVVDGEHVGYIKSGSCAHLLKVISEDRIQKIDCTIGGGPCKYISEEYDDEKDKSTYTLEQDTRPYFVHLEIEESPANH